LVTGFEPFLDEKVNPTSRLAEYADTIRDVRGMVLPVVFDRAFECLERERLVFQPDVVLSFGLAAGRTHVEIEEIAVNRRGDDTGGVSETTLVGRESRSENRRDNIGNALTGTIREGGPLALSTTLPVSRLIHALRAKGLPARRSFTAGTYVCNDLFYQTQERLLYTNVKSGFIHVPRFESLPWEKLQEALDSILEEIRT
jgi:pyroglutamyl-peptidase